MKKLVICIGNFFERSRSISSFSDEEEPEKMPGSDSEHLIFNCIA